MIKNKGFLILTIVFVVVIVFIFIIPNTIKNEGVDDINKESGENKSLDKNYTGDDFEEIYLAGGCFWGVEEFMERVDGVIDATSGYANGNTESPSYEDVISKNTGHAETVHVKYDPQVISLEEILLYYFKVINPTSLNKQGNDVGSQYRTGIYYVDKTQVESIEKVIGIEQKKYKKNIVVEVEELEAYYLAEEYHQDYLKKNPNGYCHIDLNIAQEDLDRSDLLLRDNIVDENLYTKPSDEEIRLKLGEEEFDVTQSCDTEMAFTHEYNKLYDKGIYVDIVTGEPLFSSEDKYDSGSGWPSFTKPIDRDVIKQNEDKSLGMSRLEIKSRVGDTHLGHVFDDGPSEEGGKRYCVNGSSLKFVAYEDMEKEGYGYLMDIFEE